MKLAFVVTAALALSAIAAANESHPDCEAGQPNRADGAPFMVCEGEHWDGQDPNSSQGSGLTTDFNNEAAWVNFGGSSDPGEPTVGNPLFVRASVQFAGSEQGVYTSQGLFGVGSEAVYAGSGGEVVWYGRDNTNQLGVFGPVIAAINDDPEEGDADGNILAWIVGFQANTGVPLAAFKTGEADCSQAEYQESDCERDNTAVTVDLVP